MAFLMKMMQNFSSWQLKNRSLLSLTLWSFPRSPDARCSRRAARSLKHTKGLGDDDMDMDRWLPTYYLWTRPAGWSCCFRPALTVFFMALFF